MIIFKYQNVRYVCKNFADATKILELLKND